MAGRGFGKTRAGAEWIRAQVESGRAGRIALVARTPAEIRDTMIQGKTFRFIAVNASRGKYARAEPIAALYEQGKVHHVGAFPDLEDQMCTWTPKGPADVSPARMDALVWAISHLVNRPITKIWI